MSTGFLLAGCTAVGSALCEFGRKSLTGAGLQSGTIVALVCLIQGVVGFSGLAMLGMLSFPGVPFWFPALTSAGLSSLTATLLTTAYSTGDMSLVAPFNAALPVFQFFVTTFILQDESTLPPRKVLGVVVVVASSFILARKGRAAGSLLPPGAGYVLLCCAIWSFVTKFDQMATKAAGSAVLYVAYAKFLTGVWAALGATVLSARTDAKGAGSSAAMRSLRLLFSQRRLMAILACVAFTEGLYMGCYFAAISTVSKVYVVAIKKGGNLLVSSVGGIVIFGEKAEGRMLPVLGVVAGVALMTL